MQPISASEMSPDMILEGLYKSQLQNSAHFLIVMALHDQENDWETKRKKPKLIIHS